MALQAQFINGKANGKGIMLFTENEYYVGNFLENQIDGRGEFSSPELSYVG
jgi:hypothetical protein